MRYEDLEFSNMAGRHPEIVAWQSHEDSSRGEEFCYTLLWWKKDKEGYYIEYVGDRPLKFHDSGRLMKMMKYGQAVLDAEFRLMED